MSIVSIRKHRMLLAALTVGLLGVGSAQAQGGLQSGLFTGRLILNTDPVLEVEVLRDDYRFSDDPGYRSRQLPEFNFEYVQDGGVLIPGQRGSIAGSHPLWEYILEPGRILPAPGDSTAKRVSLPFTLRERNADCMHNGVLSFSLYQDQSTSRADVVIASETCMYHKFNMRGSLRLSFKARDVYRAAEIISAYRAQRGTRMPMASIESLVAKYPGIELPAFAGAGKLPAEDISTYGYVIDDVHYRGSCKTRGVEYPFCHDLSMPSYSLAKTLIAGLAAMRLEKLYPGSLAASVADHVPECRPSGNWQDVSLENTLNMLSGNYGSAIGRDDEHSQRTDTQFFFKELHKEKISFSCNAWPRKATPGSDWVYHTTDTYLLGTAMNSILKKKQGIAADLYRDLVLPLWRDMKLSPALAVVRRSYDDIAQPFTGFGLTLLPDDIARLATALNRRAFANKLDEQMYDSAMQRLPEPQGVYPVDGKYYYRHGIWAYDAHSLLGCDEPVMIPFMSGYGGINVVMMPNDTVYYIFNDGGKYAFADMLIQSHKIRSMCPDIRAGNTLSSQTRTQL